MKGGFGHQYWGNFTADNQNALKKIAAEINRLLFLPPLTDAAKSGESIQWEADLQRLCQWYLIL